MASNTISDDYKATLLGIRQGTSRDWGTTGARNAGAPILEVVRRSGIAFPTLLDYGAGEGTLKEYLNGEAHSLQVYEYDPGMTDKQKMPEGKFDFVVSTDVLEHVEREYIDAVLAECFDKARFGVFHHIARSPTGHYLPDGRDYHILLESHEWWEQKLCDIAGGNFLLMECSSHARLQRGEYKESSRFYFERVGDA